MLQFIWKALRAFKNNWRKPEWWQFRLPSLMVRGIYPLFLKENNGIYVMKEDWDNLIILDACRYDLFTETNWLKGKLEKKISRGSHTQMFMEENFKEYYPDTIYISANPSVWEIRDLFYKTIYIDSILPEILLAYTLKINRYYPHKRLIVHFVQPHDPFIGETKIEVPDDRNPWYLFARGKIKESVIRKAYQDNLKRVLPCVEKLIKELRGKTIITSDHGEAFGAKIPFWPIKIYGHSGPWIQELTEVPWFTIDKAPRKKIIREGEKEIPIILTEEEIKRDMQIPGYF